MAEIEPVSWEVRNEIRRAVWGAKRGPRQIREVPFGFGMRFRKCPVCGSEKFREPWYRRPLRCAFCGRDYVLSDGWDVLEKPEQDALVGYVKLRPSMR